MYNTHSPCSICLKLIINSGVELVIFDQQYPDELAEQIAAECGWNWKWGLGVVGKFDAVTKFINLSGGKSWRD